MTDIIKYDMTDIWATAGDVVAPDSAKIRAGWGVEVVPRQWWNWFENRQDQNIAYLLQKGIPEWDATTEYIVNKSYVTRSGIVYRATATSTNSDPIALTSWVRAFSDYSVASNALGSLTPVANRLPYFDSNTTAATTALTAFARSLLDDADAVTMRTTLSAQQANTNLTALSGVTAVANGLPYFTGTTAMGVATLTAFARSLIGSADAAAARVILEVDSAASVSAALAAGLATRQPLNATLTTLATTTPATNKLPYFTGATTAATTDLTAYARTVLAAADAAAARTLLSVDSSATSATNLSAGLATRQPLNVNLTAISSLSAATDTLPYFTGDTTAATTSLTAYMRTVLASVSAATARTTLGLGTAATGTVTTSVSDNTSGRIMRVGDFGLGVTSGAAVYELANIDTITTAPGDWRIGTGTAGTLPFPFGQVKIWGQASTILCQYAQSFTTDEFAFRRYNGTSWTTWLKVVAGVASIGQGGTGATDAATARSNLGANNAANLTTGLIPLDRLPTGLSGKVAEFATTLQTARTINGVPFNGSANITLPSSLWGGIGGTLSNQTDLQSALNAKLDETAVGFTYIYPNGGSAGAPATLVAGTRYVSTNPFPNFHVMCVAEVLYNGIWAPTGTAGNLGTGSAGWFTVSSQFFGSGDIATQTGASGLMYQSSVQTGGGHGTAVATSLTSGQVRVKVFKLRGTY